MNRIFTVTLFLCSIISSTYAQTGGAWTRKADLSTTNRESAIGFSISSKGYIGLGIVGGSPNGTLWEYDYITNVWTQKANMTGGGRVNPVAFVIGSIAYVGTGEDISFNLDKKFYQYNPSTNTWTTRADFGGTARTEAVAFTIAGKGYVGTGYDAARKKDFWEYDPTANTWTQKADFGGTARHRAVGFAIGNKGYVGTGNDGARKKDFWEYDPTTNAWSQKADFGGAARESAVGFVLNNKGYIATGDAGTGKNDIWEYNPAANDWVQRANFTGQRRYVAAGFANASSGKGYIGTGFTDEPAVGISTKDFYEFTPAVPPIAPSDAMATAYTETSIRLHWLDKSSDETDFIVERSTNGTTFTTLATLPAGTVTHTDNGLTTGQKYYYRIRSNKTSDGPSAATNAVSQTTGTAPNGVWNTLGSNDANSGRPRFDNDASTFTLDNIIYLTASGELNGSPLASAKQLWAYDPAAGTFTQKAIFPGVARTRAVAFALNGKGYVGSGSIASGSTNSAKDFWQYDPITNQWAQKADLSTVGRFNAFAFTVGNKAYVGAGVISSTGMVAKDFYEYDPIADTWTQKTDVPNAGANLQGTGYQNKGYVVYSASTTSMYEYDPTGNAWTVKSNFPILNYSFRSLAVIKDRLFASTYDNISPYRSTLWEFEMAEGRWIERALHATGSQYGDANIGIANNLIYYFYQYALFEYNPDFELKIPASVVAEIIDPGKVKLTWSPLDNTAAQAEIYRAESDAGPYTLVAQVARDKSAYIDEVEVGSKTLYYKVRATNGALASDFNEPVAATRRGAWKQLKKIGNSMDMFGDIAVATSTRGYLGVNFYSQTWWEFNPENETWTQKANFPGEVRSYASGFTIDDQIYAGFGYIYDNAASKYQGFNDFYSYSPSTNTWTKKKDFPGTRRMYTSVTSGNGKGYLLGGDDDAGGATSFLNDAWEYSPADDSWIRLPDMPVGSAFVTTFFRDNKLVFMNGSTKSSATSYGGISQNYQLDLATGIWTKDTPPQFGLSGPVHQINDEAYFYVGGMTNFNFTTKKWSTKPGFPGNPFSIKSFLINGKIYAVNSNYEVWVYSPDAAVPEPVNFDSNFLGDRILLTWQNTSTRPVRTEIQYLNNDYQNSYSTLATTAPGATQYTVTNLLTDNNYRFRVVSIVESGEQSAPSNAAFENSGPYWTELPKVPMTSRTGALSFIVDGKLYYGTGTTSSSYLKDLWEYDLTTGVWTQKADFPGVERSGATTFTLGSSVYVGFGRNAGANSLKDLYRYSPSTNTWTASVNYPNNNTIYEPGVFVANGYAYLIGGYRGGFGTVNELWRFDGATWTQLNPLPGETRREPMVFTANGKAYVGGGTKEVSGSTSYTGKEFWEYTISTDTWKQLKNLPDNVGPYNRSYTYAGSNSALAFFGPNGGAGGVGLQTHVYSISSDSWSSLGKPLTNDYIFTAFTTTQDPGTGYVYAMVAHGEFGLKLWRYEYQLDGPNLVEVKQIAAGTAKVKWRKMTPQPDSVVVYRSNTYNLLGTRQSVVKSADTTALSSVSVGQTYYYSIRAYSNSGQFKTSSQRVLVVDNPPTAPIELVAELVDDNIILNWQPGAGAAPTLYSIERATGNETNFVSIGNSPITTFTSSDIVAATMSYRVKATNSGGESGYSNVVTIMVTGVEEEKTIGVYPNPTSDFITVEVESHEGPVDMQLLDYHGRKLFGQVLTSTTRVDMTSYSAGIYFVNLASTKRASNKYIKIIKK
ncbi:MAG TPA: kelch repeat-containing protein [Chryseolinea sp.]|nr:kelch repeat-containing protein [Chryseolinea sp.]